jgi:hypothetical protein
LKEKLLIDKCENSTKSNHFHFILFYLSLSISKKKLFLFLLPLLIQSHFHLYFGFSFLFLIQINICFDSTGSDSKLNFEGTLCFSFSLLHVLTFFLLQIYKYILFSYRCCSKFFCDFLKGNMSRPIKLLTEIHSRKELWKIAVKVKDKWNVYKDGKQSFEVLVVDAEVNFFYADVLFAHFLFMLICSKF